MPDHGGKCQLGPSFILESVTYVTRSVRHDKGPISHVIKGTNGNICEPFCVKSQAGKALLWRITTERDSVG